MIHISSKYEKLERKRKYINYDIFFTKMNKNYDDNIFEIFKLFAIL